MLRIASGYIQDYRPQNINIAALSATLTDSIQNKTIDLTALIEKATAAIQEQVCRTNIKDREKERLITALVTAVQQNAASNHIVIANRANASTRTLIKQAALQSNPFGCVIL